MKCMICGAEIAAGNSFCANCGNAVTPAPMAGDDLHTVLLDENGNSVPENVADKTTGRQGAVIGDDTRTVLINETENVQAAAQSFQQSGLNPQSVQPGMNQQPMGGFQQPGTNQQPMGGFQQPGMNQQPMGSYGQPGMNQQPMGSYGQPGMNQQPMGGYGQPGMNQQPMSGYGQPGMNQQPMGGYQQPMMNQQGAYGQPMAQKPPRKPLSKKAKTGIIIGSIAVVLLIVFFAVILPILLKHDLKGDYRCSNGKGIVLTDGTYKIYDSEGIYEAGTYTYDEDDEEIEFTDLNGYTVEADFDAKKNTIRYSFDVYTCKDDKATVGYKLSKTFIEDWEEKLKATTETIITDEEIFEEVYWDGFDLVDDALVNPESEFGKELKKTINYDNEPALKALVESGYLEFDIYITSEEEVEIYSYTW